MNLPFTYLPIDAVLEATGIGSRSTLYAKIQAKEFPEPDHIGARARWRSDRVGEWLLTQAAQADSERGERTKAARAKAERMVQARRTQTA